MEKMDAKALVAEAFEAQKMAYTPYSHFNVGAALLTAEGKVYRGCNIENAAYTPTICAERTALFKAVSEGERNFAAIAVCGSLEGEVNELPSAPCGVCRQALAEFCPLDMPVYIARTRDDWFTVTLGELLPYSFGPANLKV